MATTAAYTEPVDESWGAEPILGIWGVEGVGVRPDLPYFFPLLLPSCLPISADKIGCLTTEVEMISIDISTENAASRFSR